MTVHDVLAGGIRLICGARPLAEAALPPAPAVYFSNHSSHLDFAIIWATLPKKHRDQVRPVAGRDYWEATKFKRWVASRIFRAVLIERKNISVANNPMNPMLAALDSGAALIVFPEGTRSLDGVIHDFKAGLYHLAKSRMGVPLVPVFLDNLSRILPKGEFLPVPLIASVHLGAEMNLETGETREHFLHRARAAILQLTEDPTP